MTKRLTPERHDVRRAGHHARVIRFKLFHDLTAHPGAFRHRVLVHLIINILSGGFRPTTPFYVAQATMEKEVSVPTAMAQKPADTATAEPVLDPPGSFLGS